MLLHVAYMYTQMQLSGSWLKRARMLNNRKCLWYTWHHWSDKLHAYLQEALLVLATGNCLWWEWCCSLTAVPLRFPAFKKFSINNLLQLWCCIFCNLQSFYLYPLKPEVHLNYINCSYLTVNTHSLIFMLDIPLWYTNNSKQVKFTLEQATKAQRGSRGIAQLFL